LIITAGRVDGLETLEHAGDAVVLTAQQLTGTSKATKGKPTVVVTRELGNNGKLVRYSVTALQRYTHPMTSHRVFGTAGNELTLVVDAGNTRFEVLISK
jgi:hypothetical protein